MFNRLSQSRRTSLAIVACMSFAAAGATAQDFSKEDAVRFDRHAKAVLERFSPVLTEVRPAKSGGFLRVDWALVEPAVVDVKRTDSVLEPVQAQVRLKAKMSGAGPLPTQEGAAQAEVRPFDEFTIQAVYVPNGRAWVFNSGRVMAKQLGKWIEVKPEELRAQPGSPIAAVVRMFEVQ